jgi:hypothetical protein
LIRVAFLIRAGILIRMGFLVRVVSSGGQVSTALRLAGLASTIYKTLNKAIQTLRQLFIAEVTIF